MSEANVKETSANETSLALLQRTVVDVVEERVKKLQSSNALHLPADYSAENAMKAAWLTLQSVEDKSKNPALQVCTKDSIANALLSMIIQGLDPNKNQCYFIVYGNKLTLQRSYFGSMVVAKRVNENIQEFYPDVVYEDDEFVYEKLRGVTRVVTHKQNIKNIDRKKIIAAYCTVLFKDGSETTTVMSMDQIKQSWRQSKMYPVDDKGNIKAGTTHEKFTEEMCKKTVINNVCKRLINASNDKNLLFDTIQQTDTDMALGEAHEEISEKANKVYVNGSYTEIIEPVEAIEADTPPENPDPERPNPQDPPY